MLTFNTVNLDEVLASIDETIGIFEGLADTLEQEFWAWQTVDMKRPRPNMERYVAGEVRGSMETGLRVSQIVTTFETIMPVRVAPRRRPEEQEATPLAPVSTANRKRRRKVFKRRAIRRVARIRGLRAGITKQLADRLHGPLKEVSESLGFRRKRTRAR